MPTGEIIIENPRKYFIIDVWQGPEYALETENLISQQNPG